MSVKTKQKLELISFKLCPFVQRSVILLKEKNIEFDIKYLTDEELKNKPEWFLKLSPLGKVPILKVDEQVIFESAVINEYLDETTEPKLHPVDPLTRAKNRSWIEYGTGLLMLNYGLSIAADQEQFTLKLVELKEKLARLEEQLKGPFFNGEKIALIDIAYAPLFMRVEIFNELYLLNIFDNLPKVKVWAENLLNRKSVRESVVPEFKELTHDSLKTGGSFLGSFIK